MEKFRVFIAIEIPDVIRRQLDAIETSLKLTSATPVKWVDASNIHLTLKFLGDIEVKKIPDIEAALAESVAILPAPRLEMKGLGVFPNPQRTQIAWAGLSGDLQGLERLQQRIENSLETIGFPKERRGFSPHITLARVRDRATPEERQRFGSLITSASFETGSFLARPVHLIKSVLTRQGPVYTSLASFLPGEKL